MMTPCDDVIMRVRRCGGEGGWRRAERVGERRAADAIGEGPQGAEGEEGEQAWRGCEQRAPAVSEEE